MILNLHTPFVTDISPHTISISAEDSTPKYLQIYQSLTEAIRTGKLQKGDQLPSINALAQAQSLSRDTVVKSFKLLQQKGMIVSTHGKGFFVASDHPDIRTNVMLLLDAFTPYKHYTYQALVDTLGEQVTVDTYFHHFNHRVVETLVNDKLGNYEYYIIIHSGSKDMNQVIERIPIHQLLFLDRYPPEMPHVAGVFQDFTIDINQVLTELLPRIKHYQKLVLAFRDAISDPPVALKRAFLDFCQGHHIEHEVIATNQSLEVRPGIGFMLIDDEDLVSVLLQCRQAGYQVGEQVGILSYNETSLKKVIGDGISVISTDFALMGQSMAEMIRQNQREVIFNPSRVIDRGSF